ncbi:hypothetical protein BJ912DRAFT_923832 [Pholiota molesta]|nr:hypothetical protein BJ912DRAFT_923832 [Pholiota molesta]
MPADHSVSFSELPEPFCDGNARRPAYTNPIAQTQIGQAQAYLSLKSQLVARERPKTSSAERKAANAPYPKPILKKVDCTPTLNPPQTVPQPAARQRRVSLIINSSRSPTPGSSNSSSSRDTDAEPSSEDDSDAEDMGLISKPDGEVTRITRGGYNLQDILGWDKKKYRKIWAYVKNLSEEHLDCSRSFTSQALKSVQRVKNLASEKFPDLLEYKDVWPVVDMLRLQLKYSSGRARLESIREDADTERMRRNYRRSRRNND